MGGRDIIQHILIFFPAARFVMIVSRPHCLLIKCSHSYASLISIAIEEIPQILQLSNPTAMRGVSPSLKQGACTWNSIDHR
jgi:hypothetical protein